MKFSNYLNEAYTADMQRLFKPYLKDIGDLLAKTGISVNNLDFKDLGLVKPIALSSTLRTVKDFTETSWNDYDYLVCIFKHVSGGVSVCTGFMERDKIKDLKVISEFGDTSGKVSDAFTAKVSAKECNELIRMQRDRKTRQEPGRDKHNIKNYVDYRLALRANKNVTDIEKKAKALGFYTDFGVFHKSDSDYYSFSTRMTWESEKWKTGIPHATIYIENIKDIYNVSDKLDEHPNVVATYNFSTCSLDKKEVDQWKDAKKGFDKIFDTYEKARELADYINTFTYRDLIVEVLDN